MRKILLVDDEPSMLGFLQQLFDKAGYETICAAEGAAGLREFLAHRPDVAVVDLVMPNMDGIELCKRIRQVSHAPIIVVTALREVIEKVSAFDAGVDDYVVKPVSGRELVARVEACLRRSQWPPESGTASVYSDSYLTVNFTSREVFLEGAGTYLTPIEFALLSLFVQRPGGALSLEYLLASVWGQEYDSLNLVKWHISNLRKKLSYRGDGSSPIVTVRGFGYLYQPPKESNA